MGDSILGVWNGHIIDPSLLERMPTFRRAAAPQNFTTFYTIFESFAGLKE